jgi:hypothetical protein
MGSFRQIAPSTPAGTGVPRSSRMSTAYPGTGTEGEPGLIGSTSIPMGSAAMGHPVSVCHQLSTTGTPRRSVAQCHVSGSSRSPARKSVRRDDRS